MRKWFAAVVATFATLLLMALVPADHELVPGMLIALFWIIVYRELRARP